MDSLTQLYNEALLPLDAELEKQASELVKQAEEEDAAGRIMARGFADELQKLAGGPFKRPTVLPAIPKQDKNVTVGGGKKVLPVSGNQAPPPPPPPKPVPATK